MSVNMIFDANYLCTRNLFALAQKPVEGEKFLDSTVDQSMLARRIVDDVHSMVFSFPAGFVKRCVWCVDSSSWRKGVFENIDYKGGRKKEEKINWNVFFDVMGEVGSVLSSCGFTTSKLDLAEADDLILLWSEKFASQKETSVIVSSDRDLFQMLRTESPDVMVCLLTPNSSEKKLTISRGTREFASPEETAFDPIEDLFSERENRIVERVLSSISDAVINEIDPEWELFIKVMTGDKSDNIPAIVQWKRGEPGKDKTYSLTERMIEKAGFLRESFPRIDDLTENPSLLKSMCESILEVVPHGEATVETISERFRQNERIMRLHVRNLPKSVRLDESVTTAARFDISHNRIFSLRPNWKNDTTKNKSTQSDVFKLLS